MIEGNVGTATIEMKKNLLVEDCHIVVTYPTIVGEGDVGIQEGDVVGLQDGHVYTDDADPVGIALNSVASDEAGTTHNIRVVVLGIIRKDVLQALNPASCTDEVIEKLRETKVYVV